MSDSVPDNVIPFERYTSKGSTEPRIVERSARTYNRSRGPSGDQPVLDLKGEQVSSGSPGGAQPTYADFMDFQREIRATAREDRRELLEAVAASRAESQASRQELLGAIAVVRTDLSAEIRGVKEDLSRDLSQVESRVEALNLKTDANDRQILRMQTIAVTILGLFTFAGIVVGIIAGIAQVT